MKKLFTIVVGGLLMWSCGNSEKQQPKTFENAEEEFTSTLTEADTTKVLALATEVLDSIKSGNVEWAVESLCEVDSTGQVMPLAPDARERVARRFKTFPVVDYELDYYTFSVPMLNDLKYRTYFRERLEGETGGPAMAVMFNPVKVDGQWYLCLKEAGQPAKDAANAIEPGTIIE